MVCCLSAALLRLVWNVASAASNGSETSSPLDEDKYQAYVEKIAKAARDDAGYRAPKDLPLGESFKELAAAGAENIDLCLRFLAESKNTRRQRGSLSFQCINSMSMTTSCS
jgi:hypothetical protein